MKVISYYMVTDASVHDSQVLDILIEDAEAANIGQEASIDASGMTNQVHENSLRSRKMTKTRKVSNQAKSGSRVRDEHVFGFMTNTMHG